MAAKKVTTRKLVFYDPKKHKPKPPEPKPLVEHRERGVCVDCGELGKHSFFCPYWDRNVDAVPF